MMIVDLEYPQTALAFYVAEDDMRVFSVFLMDCC